MAERILIADGVDADRYVIGVWLQHAGYRVSEADTGAQALALVKQDPPDLVLLDVKMPDLDGFEVCERIKSDPATASVPVIHLAGSAVSVGDRTQGLARGADGYLTEPLEPEILLATIHATLRYASARRRAEKLARQLAALADTTLTINSADDLDEVLMCAARGAARIFGGPATVAAEAEDGVRYAVFDPASDREDVRDDGVSLGDVPSGAAVVTGPVPEWAELLAPSLTRTDVRVGTARLKAQPPVAVLVGAHTASGDTGEHVLTQLSQAVALAVGGLRSLDEERRIALTLQRALLPRELPVVPGIELAVRYVPASAQAEIGGDFYELLPLDGHLLIAVGDVLGHSLHAATVMGEIRHAVRAYASEGHSPEEILRQVNRLMLRFLPRELATVVLLLLDPRTGEAVICNAGHLPPLVVCDGEAEYVPLPGPLLGTDFHRAGQTRLLLAPGAALVLVTDGLVERRDMGLQDGLERLRAMSTDLGGDLDAFCDRLIDGLMLPDHEDDVALVVVRRT